MSTRQKRETAIGPLKKRAASTNACNVASSQNHYSLFLLSHFNRPTSIVPPQRAMHVLNSIEVLHENPYTGDKITKAKIVSVDKTILPPVEKSSGHEPASMNQVSKTQQDDNNKGDIPPTSASLPRYVAIKYLSDYRKRSQKKKSSSPRAPGQGWSSDSSYCSSSDSSDDEPGDGADADGVLLDENGCRFSPPLGYYRVPNRIRFGIKAKREISALKAAQGHPSVGGSREPLHTIYASGR